MQVLEDERTGLAVIQNDDAGDNCIILYGGANRRVTPELVRRALAFYGPGDMAVLQNEVNLVDEVIGQAADRGMQVALNPSPFDASIMDLPLDKVDYLLVNEIEAMQLIKALGSLLWTAPISRLERLPRSRGLTRPRAIGRRWPARWASASAPRASL